MLVEMFDDAYSWGSWTPILTAAIGDPYLYLAHAELRLTTNGTGGAGSILLSYRWTDNDGAPRTETSFLSVGVYGSPPPFTDLRHLMMGSGEDFEFKLDYDHTGFSAASGFAGDLKIYVARLEPSV